MRCYNIELLAPKNGLSIHEIWVRIIHGYRLFSRMDRPFLGCVLCTGAHYTRKITVCICTPQIYTGVRTTTYHATFYIYIKYVPYSPYY